MYTISTQFVIVLCFVISFGSPTNGSSELGFETGKIGKAPSGWFVPTPGWTAELSEEMVADGSRAAKLFKSGESTAPFGNLMKTLPASEYAGRHVTLTASVLVVGQGRAQMWLRADLAHGGTGAFDNMHDRPILDGGWKKASIEAEIEADATELNVGFMSFGEATLFIDNVRLDVSGEKTALQEPSPPKALSQTGLGNLTAAAKLLSYVRFFHPADQAAGVASWDHFAVMLMQRTEPAGGPDDLAKRLRDVFAEIAPTLQVWAGGPEEAPAQPVAPRDATQFASWLHRGAGSIGSPSGRSIYRSTIEKLPLSSLQAGHDAAFVVKDLGGGVSCRLPIAVLADDNGTLPHGKTPQQWSSPAGLPQLTAQNRDTRLAGVALGWGVFQHFYPYFDDVDTDWDSALQAALSKAAEDGDETAYLFTLREMAAKLHDGHGNVYNRGVKKKTFLPLAVEWAGEELVVVGKHDDVPDSVEVGDVIVSIDGRPIADCYTDVSKWISAATVGRRRYTSQFALMTDLPTQDPARIVLRKPSGQEVRIDLARDSEPTQNTATANRPDAGTELAPGIVYFNLDGATSDLLAQHMSKLSAAKAIVFDLRGYPDSAGIELMKHLIDAPATSARWLVPIVRQPDRQDIEWKETGRWRLMPQEPRLQSKISFLVDGRAMSYAESIMGIVEHYKLGEIVGSTTAGTNGNVNPFTLPGGYNVSWTGMKVLKHDGSRHHGVGIAPTVPVTPTAKGIAKGRDEVLEKAVEVLKAKIDA